MKSLLVAMSVLGILSVPSVGQTTKTLAWDGYVRRGKASVRAGGSDWSVNGSYASHTEEIYDSPEIALYILSCLRGAMRPGLEITPKAASVRFKVTTRRNSARIAWVCGNDLHYVEAQSYSVAAALLKSWEFAGCG